MKKIAVLMVMLAMVANLFAVNCFAVENNQDHVPSSNSGSMVIDGQLCIWDGQENAAVGVFNTDGTLSVAWHGQNQDIEVIFHITVPQEILEQIPILENGMVDLQYIIKNAKSLNLPISIMTQLTPVEEDSPTPYANSDTLKLNAVKACVNSVHSTSTYNSKRINVSYKYSPITIDVFETKTVETNKIRTRGNVIKKGWNAATVISTLISLTNLPYATVAGYVSAALSFSGGLIPDDITIEEYSVNIHYFRNAGYRTSPNASDVMCPNTDEEHTLSYAVWVNYTEADENTTNFADITHVVGDPIETYSNTESSFSVDSLIVRAYDYYRRSH